MLICHPVHRHDHRLIQPTSGTTGIVHSVQLELGDDQVPVTTRRTPHLDTYKNIIIPVFVLW